MTRVLAIEKRSAPQGIVHSNIAKLVNFEKQKVGHELCDLLIQILINFNPFYEECPHNLIMIFEYLLINTLLVTLKEIVCILSYPLLK